MRVAFLIPFLLLALLVSACDSSTTDTYGYGDYDSSVSSIASTSSSVMSPATFDGTLLSGKHRVTLKTSEGDIVLELDADVAPKTVTNFVTLAKTGYYDGLTFHRVIPGFMIQGGDPNGNGTGGASIYGAKFEDEIDPNSSWYEGSYETGTVAMANAGPNTNGSQFFIMEADYPLAADYTKFGKVISGQDIVSDIANVDRDGMDMPLTPVTFEADVN